MAISLSELRNSKKQNSISIKNLKNYIENNPLSDSEKQNIYNSMLISKRKSLENQLSNYDRKEKVEWWSDDNNFFENVGNVLYKTFIERQPTKYEEDETYNKLKSEYDEINKAIEDYRLANTEYEEGILGGFQKVGDTIAGNAMSSIKGIESSINKLTGLPTNSKITYEERLAQKARQETTGIGGVGLDLVGSFTRMLPQMLAPNPITATAIGFANYGGSAYNEAKREGADETRATIYGLTVGGLEMAMSKILGGFENVYGKSALGKLNNKILSNVIKNPTLRKTISGATGEFSEEYLQQFLEPIVRNTILGEENGADFWNTMKDDIGAGLKQLSSQFFNLENLYAGGLGLLSSVGLQLPMNISQNRINTQNKGDTATVEEIVDNVPQQQEISVEQAVEQENKASMQNLPNAMYQFTKTDNENINKLNESMSKYFDNSQKTRDLANTITKIIEDKDYSVVFDDTLTNKSGNLVNAQISTKNGKTEIKINPDSPRAVEFLMVHEITHAIENNSMKNLVLDYAKKDANFNQALENLKQTYGVDDVSSEVLADISGQLFGNQEFINNLSTQKPNIFRQIYNKIVEIANKITGNSNEALFIRDLKQKWENAYRTSEQLKQGTTYSQQQFDVSNNENLEGANKVFFNKRDNGSIYVQALDNNNKILYDFLFAGEKDIKRTLGNELGQYIFDNAETGSMKDVYINSTNKTSETDYFMSHRPTETGAFASDISNNGELMPTDVYDHPEWYFNMNEAYSKESFNALKKIKDNPNAEITIYRATTGDKINVGDWVTLSKKYADYHNNSQFDGKGNIVELKVKAKDVQFAGDDINEFGYYPNMEKYSQDSKTWQQYLEDNYKATGTRTYTKDILPTKEESEVNLPTQQETKQPKVLNPNEIAQLTKEDANTTPILPTRKTEKGDKVSRFTKNIKKSNILSEQTKQNLLSDEDVTYYKSVTNQESLDKAFERLNKGGKSETLRWFQQEDTNSDSVDIAEGFILLNQYQKQIEQTTDLAKKDELNRTMVEIARKIRNMGTKSAQTVQAMSILSRLTPEGMVYYAQSELDEAFNEMIKNKSKEWIDKYKDDFTLTPEETKFIMDTMQEVSTMEDGYDKKVKLAEIQKLMTDKLPPERGAGIKSWMRISMLFNPKTQVRNVAGNAIVAPVNWFGDLVGSAIDTQIAKKTGVRTKGGSLKGYGKGFKQGLFQSYNDFKKGINTRNIEGNRFEISQGKSFNNKTLIGKTLNKVDSLLSFMLDAGDRAFYEAEFTRSINNQMVLNNTTQVTKDMVDIATNEALQRTWQDNNNYTKFVLNIRKGLNAINVKGYGLGDVLIPFAKTPANLTKALVDYSPVGLIPAINKAIKLKRSLTNGQYTPQIQSDFVNQLGKATAGTMLYVLGMALAKAGVTSGESDDDKDVANFLKNTLGVNSYSIKIGDISFTYDWAQPLATPFAVTANFVQKQEENKSLLENITNVLDTGLNVIFEQSFLSSINDVLSEPGQIGTKIVEQLMDLPARAIPTLSSQIANMLDSTSRTSFEYNKPLESMLNSIKYKIPFLTESLAPNVNTLGEEIERYGGANNLFNVFLNPANVNVENINESASEIYRLYQATGDKTIMPRVAPYYINQNGEKITLSSKEKAEYQTISGNIISESVEDLLDNQVYNSMSDTDKATIINKIVNYAYNKARQEVLGIPMANEYNKINMYVADGGSASEYYTNKEEIDYSYENPTKYSTIRQITTYQKYNSYKNEIDTIKDKYDNTNERKYAVISYVNNLNLSIPQKAMLIKMNYSSFRDYDNQIIEYINSQDLTIKEKTDILTELGFTVRDGRVY